MTGPQTYRITLSDGRQFNVTTEGGPPSEQDVLAGLGDSQPTEASSQVDAPPSPAAHPQTRALDAGIGALKGAAEGVVDLGEMMSKVPGVSHLAEAVGGSPEVVKGSFDWARSFLKPANTAQSIGKGVEQVAEVAIPVGGLVKAGIKALPSAARAGANFEKVMTAAKDLPVSISSAANHGVRLWELEKAGATLPKAVRNFMSRVTEPGAGPVNYKEARDFASNLSQLSRKEVSKLKPTVLREVAAMSKSLNREIAEAAKQAGRLQEYHAAMREYAQAKRWESHADDVVSGVKKTLPWATAAGAATWLASKASK